MVTGNQPAEKEQVMPDKLHSFTNRVTVDAADNDIILVVHEALSSNHQNNPVFEGKLSSLYR